MLYIFAAGPDWVKMGYTGQSSAWYRVVNGFWTNDHPEQLCGQLGAEDLELLYVFEGDRKVEAALKSIHPPDHGKFYQRGRLEELVGLLRHLAESRPVPPRPCLIPTSDERLACCGGRDYPCPTCGKVFRRAHLMWEHRRDVHLKVRVRCRCGVSVTRRNLGRHEQSKGNQNRLLKQGK